MKEADTLMHLMCLRVGEGKGGTRDEDNLGHVDGGHCCTLGVVQKYL